jgi:SAM-dependent methyltransferase
MGSDNDAGANVDRDTDADGARNPDAAVARDADSGVGAGTTETAETAEAAPFVERLFGMTVDSLTLFGVYLGDRLGLYEALADGEARTTGELAAETDTHERYVREWCEAMTVWDVLAVDDPAQAAAERRYALPAAYAAPLVDESFADFVGSLPQLVVGAVTPIDRVADAFRTGEGVPYAAYGQALHEGQGRINRPAFLHDLPDEWLPAMPDVDARLREPGARVLDVGCGHGWSTIGIAGAYPDVDVVGVDLDAPSIDAARVHVDEAGLTDRVSLRVGDAAAAARTFGTGSFDLAVALECVHDVTDPVAVLRSMREAVGEDGTALVVDERVGESFAEPTEVEGIMYGWSVLHCLPVGMVARDGHDHEIGTGGEATTGAPESTAPAAAAAVAGESDASASATPPAGTGTVMRPATLREYATAAGFGSVEVLPVESFFFRLYRLEA